jgi:hypothetical protein
MVTVEAIRGGLVGRVRPSEVDTENRANTSPLLIRPDGRRLGLLPTPLAGIWRSHLARHLFSRLGKSARGPHTVFQVSAK